MSSRIVVYIDMEPDIDLTRTDIFNTESSFIKKNKEESKRISDMIENEIDESVGKEWSIEFKNERGSSLKYVAYVSSRLEDFTAIRDIIINKMPDDTDLVIFSV